MSPHCTLIDDLHDRRLDPYRDVRYRNSTRFGATFVAEGRLVVQRLLVSGYRTLSVLVEQGREPRIAPLVPAETELLCVPRDVLCELVGFRFHRGMMACGVRPQWPAATALLQCDAADPSDRGSLSGRLVAAACGITDPENLGSILRSAAALGVGDVVLGPATADPLARRVLRVSMAAALQLRFYQSTDLAADIRQWVSTGVRVVATTLAPGAVRLDQLHRDQRPTVVLLGNEADGLPPEVQQAATDLVTIPMRLGTDSLNVAVAAGIVLYELTR